MAALTLLLDAYSREAIAGGYLVMQLATLILNLDAWLKARVALIEGIADGRVVPFGPIPAPQFSGIK